MNMKASEKQQTEFDTIADNYSDLLEDSVSSIGIGDHEYFNSYKIYYFKHIFKQKLLNNNGQIKILDYGCGVGLLSKDILNAFPQSQIGGFDISSESIKAVPASLRKNQNIFTSDINKLDYDYDFAILSTVLHHVPPADRDEVLINIYERLKPDGQVIIIEHNMKNPLTVKSVKNCIFDNDAIMLNPNETKTLLVRNGFKQIKMHYTTFWPKQLSALKCLDKFIGWLPLGAQYTICAQR